MGRLFDLIEQHREAQPYPPSYSRIAERVGVSRQTVMNWRTPSKLPETEHLQALAAAIGQPYHRVLDAALIDTGYLEPPRASPQGGRGAEAG